jgi:Immunity protein 22
MSSKNEKAFSRYFEINPVDKELGVGASQFDKDVNIKWYDDDLIGIYYSESDDLDTAIDEIPTSPSSLDEIRNRCDELGISKANAMFYYEDSELQIADASKKYNGISYLGVFNNV